MHQYEASNGYKCVLVPTATVNSRMRLQAVLMFLQELPLPRNMATDIALKSRTHPFSNSCRNGRGPAPLFFVQRVEQPCGVRDLLGTCAPKAPSRTCKHAALSCYKTCRSMDLSLPKRKDPYPHNACCWHSSCPAQYPNPMPRCLVGFQCSNAADG